TQSSVPLPCRRRLHHRAALRSNPSPYVSSGTLTSPPLVLPMHRFSPLRFPVCVMSSATNRWWQPELSRRVSPPMMSPNPAISRVSRSFGDRFPRGPWNMATLSRVEGDSGKPYRRLPISSGNFIIPPLGNIETSNKDALWSTMEDISIKHDTWGQIVKPTVSEEDESSTKEDHKGNIVASDKEESSDDDVYMLNSPTECK
ncbi:unnamed protein product, partial [Urochloa humidicola]